MLKNFILSIIKLINLVVWLFIKFMPSKCILKLIKISNIKLVNVSFKNKNKYKNLIKQTLYNLALNEEYSTCLSSSITARFLFNLIGLENVLRLGITVKDNGEKVPHAWLEDKFTGEYLTVKQGDEKISEFQITL